jgi:hypothetical protein
MFDWQVTNGGLPCQSIFHNLYSYEIASYLAKTHERELRSFSSATASAKAGRAMVACTLKEA